MIENRKKSVDELFNELERMHDDVSPRRTTIINKLGAAIDKLDIDLNSTDPELLEAQLGALKSYNSLLNDHSVHTHKRLQAYQRDKEGTSNDKMLAELVTSVLNKIEPGMLRVSTGAPVVMEDEISLLDKAYSEGEDVVLETELKLDPRDVEENT